MSATLRPIGPSTPICAWKTSKSGPPGTSPCDGRKPKTLFQAAGLRSEPPKSLPSATGSMSSASATAAPPLEPPAVSAGSKAFSVGPNTVL